MAAHKKSHYQTSHGYVNRKKLRKKRAKSNIIEDYSYALANGQRQRSYYNGPSTAMKQ